MIDYKAIKTDRGYDIALPLAKITKEDDLLFQQVELLLDTHLREFIYDIMLGIDYKSFLGEEVDLTNIESEYRTKISNLVYFGGMDNFNIEIEDNRKLKISFTVYSSEGSDQTFTQII